MKKIWFKRKKYGWGWYPVTWQGWIITFAYLALILIFGSTVDDNSPNNEVFFMLILPIILLTITFIKIAYKFGEKPRWQWGEKKNEDKDNK